MVRGKELEIRIVRQNLQKDVKVGLLREKDLAVQPFNIIWRYCWSRYK